MRLLNLYLVYDKKARTIVGPIVHQQSPVPILREIAEAVKKPGLIGNNPEDFQIRHIGMIDDETGDLYNIGAELLNHEIHIVAEALALKPGKM